MNDLLTIKEFAELAGVSIQSVYKGLNNRLNPWVEIVDNKKMLKYQALQEIYGVKVEQPFQPGLNNLLNMETDLLMVLQKTIDTLQEQLKVKDKQIAILQDNLTLEQQHNKEQADKLAFLAERAQQLHAGTIQKQLAEPQNEAVLEKIKAELRQEFELQKEQLAAENEKFINWLTKIREEEIAIAIPWWKFWKKK